MTERGSKAWAAHDSWGAIQAVLLQAGGAELAGLELVEVTRVLRASEAWVQVMDLGSSDFQATDGSVEVEGLGLLETVQSDVLVAEGSVGVDRVRAVEGLGDVKDSGLVGEGSGEAEVRLTEGSVEAVQVRCWEAEAA